MDKDRIPPEEEVTDIADFFKVFSDPTRLRILLLLSNGEMAVGVIADEVGISQSAVSQQLKVLRNTRLVKWKKEGRSILYRLCDEHIEKIIAMGVEHYRELYD